MSCDKTYKYAELQNFNIFYGQRWMDMLRCGLSDFRSWWVAQVCHCRIYDVVCDNMIYV